MPGLGGIPYQTVVVPFARGIQTRVDPRALQPPDLSICSDVEFDDVGALRTRKPYVDAGVNLSTGGTLANIRKVFANGAERLAFTNDSLYSWNVSAAKWVLKSTHLAVSLDEQEVFATTGDQVQCDRCELSGVEYTCWSDGGNVYLGARNLSDNSVIRAPTLIAGGTWPRVVALSTKVLLLYISAINNIDGAALDPANVAAAISPTTLLAHPTFAWTAFDAEKIPSADTAIVAVESPLSGSYTVAKITSALAVTSASKSHTLASSSPIAVTCMPNGATATVFRCSTFAIVKADMITISSLADGTVDTTIGTAPQTVNQIAAAYRSVQVSGHYQCEIFYAFNEGPQATGAVFTRHNTINDASTIGSDGNLIGLVVPVSRAFDHGGRVFVWTVFGQQSGFLGDDATKIPELAVQNACYLIRDDAHICAKAVYEVASSALATGASLAYGALPGVQSLDGLTYTFCSMARRKLALGNSSSGYGARSPRIVAATFDSNEARRVVRLGRTLYVTGGEIKQYDGVQLVEVGFHVAPHYFNASAGGVGNVANGTYGDELSWRWMNATGETERSTSAVRGISTMAAGPKQLQTGTNTGLSSANKRWFPLYLTHKTNPAVAVEVWRTLVNPTADSPLYLVSGQDPTVVTGNNRYVANDPTLLVLGEFDDAQDDPTAGLNEENPENNGSLENLAPPAATIIAAGIDRIFLGGVAGQPDRIWYSKQRLEGSVAAFNDELAFSIPPIGGDMTALAIHPQTQMLIAFRERSIWELPGVGIDNTGGGANYGPPIMLSSDIGAVNADAVAAASFGLFFKSAKGFYRMGGGSDLAYIGDDVAAYNTDTVLAIHVMESQHQIRVLTDQRVLVYDYQADEWSVWSLGSGVGAAMWDGAHVVATATTISRQASDFSAGVAYGQDVELAFFKPPGLVGNMIVRRLQVLGEYRSACALRVRLARDYQQDGAGNWVYYDDEAWPVSPTTVGSALQVAIGPSQQRCEAIKVRLSALGPGGNATLRLVVPGSSGTRWIDIFAIAPGTFGNGLLLAGTSTGAVASVRDGTGVSAGLTVPSVIVNILLGATTYQNVVDMINAQSHLATATATGAVGSDIILVNALTGSLAGGVNQPPSGEALKLTAVAFEIGVEGGLYPQLPVAQKI